MSSDLRVGRPRELARALTTLEKGGPEARRLVADVFPRTGRARVVGITGPAGAGKSTLVDRLARLYRERGETVAILAVDPSSPFTGGALLGDRVRMSALYTDPGVFIRSMATRGALGGLSRATFDAVDLLDAAGFDHVLLETVGVGQDEVDVVRAAQTVAVVVVPGMGDDVQAIKAGLLEIADVFVLNKADREGADATRRDLEQMLLLTEPPVEIPIVATVASLGEGIEETARELDEHRGRAAASGELAQRRRRQMRFRLERILVERCLEQTRRHDLDSLAAEAASRHSDPYQLADRLLGSSRDDEET